MTINQFDKVNLKVLRQEINDALRLVSDKNGIEISMGNNISFDVDRFTCRLSAVTKSDTGFAKVSLVGTNIFSANGFKVGDTFKHNTKVLTVVAYNNKKPKNCVELKDQNGLKFDASLEMVSRKFKV